MYFKIGVVGILASLASFTNAATEQTGVSIQSTTESATGKNTVTYITIHTGDSLQYNLPSTGYKFVDATAFAAKKIFCTDKMPAIDVAVGESLTCENTYSECATVFTGCSVTAFDPYGSDGFAATFKNPPTDTFVAFSRYLTTDGSASEYTANHFFNITVLGSEHQASAFAAAYAAGTFLASSLLVAALALF